MELLGAAFWRECPTTIDPVLGVKDKILTVDLPHELSAKFDSLFKLPFGLAPDRSNVPQASDARDAPINLRE